MKKVIEWVKNALTKKIGYEEVEIEEVIRAERMKHAFLKEGVEII